MDPTIPVSTSSPLKEQLSAGADVSASVPEIQLPSKANGPVASGSKRPRKAPDTPLEPLDDVLLRRITTIKEGDNVLLRMPSDAVKAVVASKDGCVLLQIAMHETDYLPAWCSSESSVPSPPISFWDFTTISHMRLRHLPTRPQVPDLLHRGLQTKREMDKHSDKRKGRSGRGIRARRKKRELQVEGPIEDGGMFFDRSNGSRWSTL